MLHKCCWNKLWFICIKYIVGVINKTCFLWKWDLMFHPEESSLLAFRVEDHIDGSFELEVGMSWLEVIPRREIIREVLAFHNLPQSYINMFVNVLLYFLSAKSFSPPLPLLSLSYIKIPKSILIGAANKFLQWINYSNALLVSTGNDNILFLSLFVSWFIGMSHVFLGGKKGWYFHI